MSPKRQDAEPTTTATTTPGSTVPEPSIDTSVPPEPTPVEPEPIDPAIAADEVPSEVPGPETTAEPSAGHLDLVATAGTSDVEGALNSPFPPS